MRKSSTLIINTCASASKDTNLPLGNAIQIQEDSVLLDLGGTKKNYNANVPMKANISLTINVNPVEKIKDGMEKNVSAGPGSIKSRVSAKPATLTPITTEFNVFVITGTMATGRKNAPNVTKRVESVRDLGQRIVSPVLMLAMI